MSCRPDCFTNSNPAAGCGSDWRRDSNFRGAARRRRLSPQAPAKRSSSGDRTASGASGEAPRQSGFEKQNTHLVTPGQIRPAVPIIGLPALLRLVEWYQERRRNTQQGGLSCANLEPPLSPPAPQQDKSSTESSAAVGDPSRRATRTNSQRADPRRRPTTGEASGRQGGDA